MKLPPWSSDDPEDQKALTRFVINELELTDDQLIRQFASKFAERSADPEFFAKANDQMEAERLAKRHGGSITWPEDKRRQGHPGHKGNFARAVRDVKRIREIFRKNWPEKKRRMHPPTAEQIAAERWGLSDEEATKLHKRFQRG